MEEYVSKLQKKSLNDYPHDSTKFYPYGYTETGCEESVVESGMPEITIRFAAPHQNEYLVIQSFDGSRTGFFTLYTSEEDEPFALMIGKLENGLIEGYCEIYRPDEGKIFEGDWARGQRDGTCIEYDFGNVSFQGSYHNDKRNGYGWEYHNNELQREGIWLDGEYQMTYYITKQVNFSSTGLGMTINRKGDDMIVITSPWEENKANGFGYAYSMNKDEIIQSYLYLHGDGVDNTDGETLPTYFTEGTLQLAGGYTWTGSIARNAANGKGILRSPQGVVLYEGKMLDNARYGKGKSYYPNGKVEYDGMWAFDRRMGNGVEFDEFGTIKQDGVFIDDVFAYPTLTLTAQQENLVTHVLLREFIIGDHLLNDVVDIDFTQYALLTKLVVGEHSLKELSELNVKGLQCLQTIEIGRHSFTQCVCVLSPINLNEEQKKAGYMGRTISQNETRIRAEMKRMVISGCPVLEKVVLQQGACSDFYGCIVEDAPKLHTLQFGEIRDSVKEEDGSYNFYYATDLELRNLPSLQTLTFGNRSFNSVMAFRIHNMEKLTSLAFGNRAFFGKKIRDHEDKLVCASRFSWRELPALTSLRLNNNFVFYRSVALSDIPNCAVVEKTAKCFPSGTNAVELDNVHDEINRIFKP